MGYELTRARRPLGPLRGAPVKVELTDIAFGLAGDGEQDLASKPATYAPGLTSASVALGPVASSRTPA